jgi:hypothetical protein
MDILQKSLCTIGEGALHQPKNARHHTKKAIAASRQVSVIQRY